MNAQHRHYGARPTPPTHLRIVEDLNRQQDQGAEFNFLWDLFLPVLVAGVLMVVMIAAMLR